MKTFLSLKHWQLFLLIYCLPFTLLIAMFGYLVIDGDDVSGMLLFYKLFLLVFLISMGIYFYWLWSLANFFGKNTLNTSTKTKLKVLLPLSFLCYVSFVTFLYFNIEAWVAGDTGGAFLKTLGVLLIVGLIFGVSFLISISLIAKIFKIAKMGHIIAWTDFISEFLLLWFYPIGIWIIQPQVNKMLRRNM